MSDSSFSILIATYGNDSWRELALTRAYPSCVDQGALEVLIDHDPEGTLAGVRNALAKQASGSFLVVCDADDELEPGYIDAMSQTDLSAGILNPSVRFVVPRQKPKPPRMFKPRDLRQGNYLIIGSAMRSDLFWQAGGFDPKWRAWEDWALLWRIVALGGTIETVPDAVYRAHWSAHGRNNTVDRPQELMKEIRADFDAWQKGRE